MRTSRIFLTALALAATSAALSAADTAALWAKNCQMCHGANGKGQTPMGRKLALQDLTDAKYQDSFTDEKAFKDIKEGVKDGDKTKMKPAVGLSDDDIKALVAKVRGYKK